MSRAMVVQLSLLGICLAAAISIGWTVFKEIKEDIKPKTVEKEEDDSRVVVGVIGCHHPRSSDVEDCADDPIATFVEGMELDRRVNAL